MKVSDLEKFALEQVYRPYQNMIGMDERLDRLNKDFNLENATSHLKENPNWAAHVLDRIKRCEFTFSPYLQDHELVRLILKD